jgi:two-component system, cell cycle sensor histidine kinase and response regulator CckA
MRTVLVVDDDLLVRDVVARILEASGYATVTAKDGYDAIRLLADRHVDLMITDVKMPGLDGADLGMRAKSMRPELHVIYMTGFSDGVKKVQHGVVIEKPVRAADLMKIVRHEISPN